MKTSKAFWAALGLASVLGASLAAQNVQITGAGATFPYPIYSKWFDEYHKLHPNVAINYQSIGSGGGIRQITNQTVFFGAIGWADDERAVAGGARKDSALPDGAGRRRSRLQHSEREGSEVFRTSCSPTSSSARSRNGTIRRSPN